MFRDSLTRIRQTGRGVALLASLAALVAACASPKESVWADPSAPVSRAATSVRVPTDVASVPVPTATRTRTTPVPPKSRAPLPHRAADVDLSAAAAYARKQHLRYAIAVSDIDGHIWTAGSRRTFGTASVVKILVVTKMLLTGAMHGADGRRAYQMITRSDDTICNELWNRFGGPSIPGWLDRHYDIPLGYANTRPGFWGNTQISARGLAQFYVKVAGDPRVWPWLHRAMAHTRRIAADGTDQYFGIPDAGGGHIVKQGWGSACAGDGYTLDATVNSTGYVRAGGRWYVIVILTEGDANNSTDDAQGYNHQQGAAVTGLAKRVLHAITQRNRSDLTLRVLG